MNKRILLSTLLLGSLAMQAWAADSTDGEIIVGRQVPARVAYRDGVQSPDVSSARTSDAATIRHLAQSPALSQNDLLLAATVTNGAISRNIINTLPATMGSSIIQRGMSTGSSPVSSGNAAGSVNHLIQQGMAPLGAMPGR